MHEFTMQVLSVPAALTGDEDTVADQLALVHEFLIRDSRVLGPAVDVDNLTAAISATFQVMANRLEDAQDAAGAAFNDALAKARIDSRWDRIESDDEPPR